MKILAGADDGYILAIGEDVELIGTDDSTEEDIYRFKDKNGKFYGDAHQGKFIIFDTGDDEVLNKELMEAELPGNYCIEDGRIIIKQAASLNMIREVKRDVSYIINTLELNQLEILYELSLLQLGLTI